MHGGGGSRARGGSRSADGSIHTSGIIMRDHYCSVDLAELVESTLRLFLMAPTPPPHTHTHLLTIDFLPRLSPVWVLVFAPIGWVGVGGCGCWHGAPCHPTVPYVQAFIRGNNVLYISAVKA